MCCKISSVGGVRLREVYWPDAILLDFANVVDLFPADTPPVIRARIRNRSLVAHLMDRRYVG